MSQSNVFNVIRGTFGRVPLSQRRDPLDGGYLATKDGAVLYLGDMLRAERLPAEGEELRITIEAVEAPKLATLPERITMEGKGS